MADITGSGSAQGSFVPPGPEAKVFVISVAAELSGLHPQTLRTYDRLGLVAAGRTGRQPGHGLAQTSLTRATVGSRARHEVNLAIPL